MLNSQNQVTVLQGLGGGQVCQDVPKSFFVFKFESGTDSVSHSLTKGRYKAAKKAKEETIRCPWPFNDFNL